MNPSCEGLDQGERKTYQVQLISSVKKKNKKRKKSQLDVKQKQSDKSSKKRQVIFHISKKRSEESTLADGKENISENVEGKIKKYEHKTKIEQVDSKMNGEIINLKISNDSESNVVSFNPKDAKNFEKFDIINSEKLNELLSSKKKHRYKNVVDSMNDMVSEHIGHQIDFNYEEENLQIQKYELDHSKTSDKHEKHQSEDADVINQTDDILDNCQAESQVRDSHFQEQLVPVVYNTTESDHDSQIEQELEDK